MNVTKITISKSVLGCKLHILQSSYHKLNMIIIPVCDIDSFFSFARICFFLVSMVVDRCALLSNLFQVKMSMFCALNAVHLFSTVDVVSLCRSRNIHYRSDCWTMTN